MPPTCKLIGSWAVTGGGQSVIVVEAESFADVVHISGYYAGWLDFDRSPPRSVPRHN